MTACADNSTTGGDVAPAQEVIGRMTVALVPQAGASLQRLQDRTSLSKTDITNRAITLYEFIESQLSAGRELLIRDGSTGEIQRVLLV
jgi:hypothetical protein